MLTLLLALLAFARADEVALPTVDELMALPSTPERVAALQGVLAGGTTDGTTLAKAATAIQVLTKLEEAGRDDPAIVRGFLEAALSDELERREDAVEVAATGLPPGPHPPAPTGGVAPVVVGGSLGPRSSANLDALRAYDAGRLYKDERQVLRTTISGNWAVVSSYANWTVFQDSRALASTEFARTVGDANKLAHFRRQDRLTAGLSIGFAVAGIGVLAGGIAMLADETTDNDLGGGALVLSSTLPFTVSIATPLGMTNHRKWVANTYEPVEADEWIDRHNDALRAELGLTEADVRDIEIGPR